MIIIAYIKTLMHLKNRKIESGFTLIELLVVIAIIGLLSSIILASLSAARAKARDAHRFSYIRQINNAILLYISSFNVAPPSILVANNVPNNPLVYESTDSNWINGPTAQDQFIPALLPYLKKLPHDPCGGSCPDGVLRSYEYLAVPGTDRYKIFVNSLEKKSGAYGFNTTNISSLIVQSPTSAF
ncbi:MAG: hypothetical protein JWO73_810 [Candidatus Taylorbacteria bacterium]|nr:hypothetical protein [Candidatus Taylorbacteria bacterium]